MPDINIKDNTITGVWTDVYSTNKLPKDLYHQTGKHLSKGVKKGYNLAVKYGTKDEAMLKSLHDNIWFFSAAKTYQNVRGMEAAKKALQRASHTLVDKQGNKITPFKAFRDGYKAADGTFVEGVSQIFDTFNETWLRTEYDTALGMSQLASRWQNIEEMAHVLPYLRINAVNDGVTCEICAEMDGITLPADSDFWDDNFCMFHFLCRCTYEQLDEVDGKEQEWTEADARSAAALSGAAGRTDQFKFNPGKDRVIFQEEGPGKHSYFDVAKGDSGLLKTNFGLPLPNAAELKGEAPIYTLEEAQEMMSKYDITEDEKKAIFEYTRGESAPINAYLRGKRAGLTDEYTKTMNTLNNFLKDAPKVDVTAYRGYTTDAENFKMLKALKKGDPYPEKAFMSSSYDKSMPDNFLGNEPWQVVLTLKSEKGVLIEDFSNFKDEKEILFNSNSKFTVESIKSTGKPGKYGKIFITLTDK